MDLNKPIEKHKGVNLPHRQQREASISVTFRLADSLPAPVVERLAAERRQLERELAMMGCLPGDNEYRRLEQLQSQKFEELLDRCQGECVLKSDKIAQCVSDALLFFDQQRYQMYAFCIMPNHVHSLFSMSEGVRLEEIVHSWKSFTAKRVNVILGRTGTLCQSDYYDRLIRGQQDFASSVRYIVDNPVVAGLRNWKWVYLAPSLVAEFKT